MINTRLVFPCWFHNDFLILTFLFNRYLFLLLYFLDSKVCCVALLAVFLWYGAIQIFCLTLFHKFDNFATFLWKVVAPCISEQKQIMFQRLNTIFNILLLESVFKTTTYNITLWPSFDLCWPVSVRNGCSLDCSWLISSHESICDPILTDGSWKISSWSWNFLPKIQNVP